MNSHRLLSLRTVLFLSVVVCVLFIPSNSAVEDGVIKDYTVRPDGSILYDNGQIAYGIPTFTATDDIKYLKSDHPGASLVDQGPYWSTPNPSPLSGRFYDDGRIYLGKDTDHYIGMKPVGIFYINYQDPTEREQLISLTSMTLSVNDNVATYSHGAVTIVFTNSFSQIKGDVIFPNAPPIPTVSNPALAVVWEVVGHAGISIEDGERGDWWFEQTKAAFPVGDIQNNGSAVLKKKIFRQNGKIYLVEGVGYGWVSDVNRTDSQFIIDPTLEYNGSDSWAGTSGTMIEHGDTNLRNPPSVTTGLVSYWNPATDVGSGNTLTDIWGSNDGTIYGATWNVFGGGLDYNGTSDYVDCGNDESLNITNSSFSIEVYIKYSTDKWAGLVSNYVSSSSPYILLYERSDGSLQFNIRDVGTTLETIAGKPSLSDGDYHHVVAIRNKSDKLYLYVDGILYSNSATDTLGDITLPTTWHIGKYTSNYFNDTIVEVRIYYRALTNDEINRSMANYHPLSSYRQIDTANDYGAGQVLKYINVTGTDPSANTTMALYVNGSHDNVTFNGWELVNGSCNVGDNVTVPTAYEYRYSGSPGVDVVSNTSYQPETNVIESIILTSDSPSAPIITLLSQDPSIIYKNSTGYLNISYGVSHSSAGLNNTSVSFIYRDYDHDLGDSNHSIRPPGNNLASEWNFDGRILRAANRNESLNFENNDTITGGNTYSWSGLDENNSEMSIVPINSSYTKVYINSTIHRITPNMYYIDRSEIQEAPKTTIGIHKSQNVLVKFWNFEIFKGNTDFLGVGYTDTALHASSAHHPSDANPVKYYYVSSGYDPVTDGDPLTSGYAVYMGSLNATGWVDYVCSPHANASYVRGFINNTLLHQYVTTTNISYIYFTSNTPSSKPFYINVTDVATSSNVSFADTNVMWAGDNVLTQQSFTPDMWFAFMKDNISFDHKIYVADNNDNWANSTLSSTMIGAGLFPPTSPAFYAFHNGFQDFDMNGTYHDTIQVQVSASSDPDGGVVTHNITLHYGNQTLVGTINGSAVAEDGVYTNVSFNTTPYYSQTENYTLRVVATDDEGETATTWLGVNFTLYVTPNATNLANSIYDYGVNFTWDAGSGAITDSYNVSLNSTWYNGSAQTWANNSTVAHGSIEIIVYAYNESSGLSAGYLTDNVTVPNNIPVLSGIPNLNTNEDNDLLDIIDLDDYYSDTDSDTPSFSVESNNQSAHMTIDISGANTVDFIPDADWYGTAEIVFKAEDGYGGSDTDTMIFTVNSVNDAPVLDSIGAQNVNENETLYINADATDVEGDTLTFSCSRTDLFTDFSTSTGQGNWTPGFADAGTYYVDFGVSDGSLTDNETVTITVVDVPTLAITSYTPINNRPPDIPDDDRTFTVVFNQVCNITWYYNGILQQTNTSVDNASWTSTAVEGTWDVTTIGTNTNGTASHTWTWIVAPPVYVPISIFAGLCGVMLMSLGGAIYLTGPVGIVTSLLGMVLAFLNSKIVINGTLIQNIGGIDSTGNVVQGVTVIQIPALSYLFTFIGIIMLGLTVYLVYREIEYRKTSGYQEVDF